MSARSSVPKCPYCGKDDSLWWDGVAVGELRLDGDSTEMTCARCERTYEVTIHRDIAFSTSAITEPPGPRGGGKE